jgi:RimJ/RimL family protein N-acetyltransferase
MTEVRTARLLLRRPVISDAGFSFVLHGDPATNAYNPDGPDRDRGVTEERLRGWIEHWDEHGLGYFVVEQGVEPLQLVELVGTTPVGFVGVRHADAADWGEGSEPVLNLYYRFLPRTWGRGYAFEAACACLEWLRGRSARPVVAVVASANEPSLALARRLGLRPFREVVHTGVPSLELRFPPTP